jgi:hypothetical protein
LLGLEPLLNKFLAQENTHHMRMQEPIDRMVCFLLGLW